MLSKTDYIIWRDCHKNAWLKVHKPEIYRAHTLSAFELQIIETGNEVDLLARDLFPTGEYQKRFETDGYLAITDILTEKDGEFNIYEVKATNDIDKKTHLHDLTFQYIVLKRAGLNIKSANLVHLNSEYVRQGELDITQLFMIEDMTETVEEMAEEVFAEMQLAKEYLESETEPVGPCDCLKKGRSAHCTTFSYSNPGVPEYGIHDLTRIGLSKRKLTELVDSNIFKLEDIPEALELSDVQKNQVWTYLTGREIISKENISEELDKLVFPLYFLDYETFPAAIPRFDGFSPYNQIPFQYSLHILSSPEEKIEHVDFLYSHSEDPSRSFVESLQGHIEPKGSIVVWHKDFECGRNRELAKRIPESKSFFDNIETRIFDLEIIFKKQQYVHKDFKGSSSIKKVLPVLVPQLSYKDLEIKEGGAASIIWGQMTEPGSLFSEEEKLVVIENLKTYCKLDTYAMYAIWASLYQLITGKTLSAQNAALKEYSEEVAKKYLADELIFTWSDFEQQVIPGLVMRQATKSGLDISLEIAISKMNLSQKIDYYTKIGGDKNLARDVREVNEKRNKIYHAASVEGREKTYQRTGEVIKVTNELKSRIQGKFD